VLEAGLPFKLRTLVSKIDWDYSRTQAHMGEGNTGKIYFLSERGRRSAARLIRKRSEPAASPTADRRKPSAQETTWLSRALFIEGLYFTLIWLAEGTDFFAFGPDNNLDQWLYSFFPAEIFVAVVAIVGAYELQRHAGARDTFALVAAGGLVFLALERLALLVSGAFRHALTPGERLEITAMGICMGVGVWTVSHSLRLRAER